MDRHKGDKAVKTLAEVMSVAPLTVGRRASVLSALEVMRERRISSVLVGEPDDPQGIITERDLVGWLHRRLDLNVAACGDVMHGPLVTLPDTASYIEAHHEMAQRGIRHLGVRNADGRVVGMVSESDILGAIGVEYFTEFKSVRNLMTPVVCTLPPDARVSDAVDLMNRERQTSVVVVDEENRPIGLLTERDIVRLAVEGTTPLDSALRVAASRPVRTVSADGLVHEAVATMENLRIRRLVVVDNDGQVVGLLSQHEIVSGLENQYIRLLKNVIDRQNLHQRNTAQPLNERAMLDSLLAAHPDGLSILTDHDYVVQAANPAACDVLRVTVDVLIGGDLAALLAQIGVSAELPLAAAKLSGEAVIEAAPRADEGDGDSDGKTLELRIRRLSHPDHGLQGYLITGRDLSERRQAEEALLAERDFSDAIIAGLPGLFYLIDEDGRLLRWNSAWREFGAAAGRTPRHGALLEDLLGLEAASEVEKIRWAVRQTEAEIETTVRMKSDDSRVYLHKLRRVDIGRRHLLIGSAIDITKSKRSMAEAERLARIDTLTGLPNRHAFIERLSAALAISDGETAHTALLFLDIDNFKNVNDTLGHVVGDSLLRAAGHRLERVAAGRRAELARLGGDEFALIKTGDWTDGAPEELAGAVVDSLSRPFSIDGHQIFVGASVGIVVYPGDYVEKSDLLAQADLAMYRAKAAGRSCWRRFEAWMAIDAQRRRLIESELREAVHRDQFELYYQPKLALADGRITGAEALIRWRHPALGMINPDEFIGLAESTGLIAPVGEWVLHAACMEAARWAAAGRPLKVAVNVSPVQFLRHDLVGAVREALDASGLPPTLLELEVTENAVVADAAKAQAILDQVTALGVTIAMDDFGAGYSSLAQLRRLRFNTLKIDRSLVSPLGSDADALAVIATVVALGGGLGMTVVAEGIETATHLEILKDVGCHEGQGFHFWRPLPAPLFREIIAEM